MTSTLRCVPGALAAALLVLAACSASSVTMPTSMLCTNAGLVGKFGSQRSGQTAPGTLTSAVGLATFDGKGTLIETQTISTNGTFSTVTNMTSTYTVADDCTGFLSDASGTVVARITVVHDGSEVLGMSAQPGSNASVHYEKIIGPCSLATLKGRYGVQRNGQTKTGALLAIGTLIFDGKGNDTAQQIIDKAGTLGMLTDQVGAYTVNPDCTSTGVDPVNGVVAQQVVVGGGAEVLGISLTAGNNVVVHYEREQDP